MNTTYVLTPILSILAGLLILLFPDLLAILIGAYLLIAGIVGLLGAPRLQKIDKHNAR